MSKENPQGKSGETSPMQSSEAVDQALPPALPARSKPTLEDLLRDTPADNRVLHWEQIRSAGLEF